MLTIRCALGVASGPSAAREWSSAKAGAGSAGRVLLAAAILLTGAGQLFGVPITSEVVPPEPGQENFTHLWDVTLHNPTPGTSSVSFRVEARNAKVGIVFSASTQPIELAPGERRLTAADVKLTDVSCKKGYEAFAESDKALPEGDYTYLVTLVPGMRQNALFLRIRAPRPVELAWPPEGVVVGDTQPLLVWRPPVASGPVVAYDYRLRVVEVERGQTGATAIERNRPIFEGGRVSATAYRLPAPTLLIPGRTYAWQVVVLDTSGLSADATHTGSKGGSFVYKPGESQAVGQTSFTFPKAGRSVNGNASLVVKSDVPDAELCVLEYLLGSDFTGQDWHVIGSFPQTRGAFVGTWGSDAAVIRAGQTLPSPCFVRATVLGRTGQSGQTEPLPLVINKPPSSDRRGCGGCNWRPEE